MLWQLHYLKCDETGHTLKKKGVLKVWGLESVDGIDEWFSNVSKGEITLEKFAIKMKIL